MHQQKDSTSTGESVSSLLQSSGSTGIAQSGAYERDTGGGGLGGLSRLSTLTGLLDTASTFKPKKEESVGNQRNGKGDSTNNTKPGRYDSGRFSELSRNFGGGVQSGRTGGWNNDRDGGRLRNDGLQKSFGPRAHGTFTDVLLPCSSAASSNDSNRQFRSTVSTPGTTSTTARLDVVPSKSESGDDRNVSSSQLYTGPIRVEPAGPISIDSDAVVRTGDYKSQSWRPRRQLDPSEQLRRDVNVLLNKLTIENFPTVAEKFAKLSEEIKTKEDLGIMVELVLDKAFGEPDFSQLYADLCLVLSYRCLPTLATSGKTSLFSSLLIQKWREAFDKMPPTIELTEQQKTELNAEEREQFSTKMKTRVRGMCVSLAEFVVRRIVGMGRFSQTASILLERESPEEHYIEGICQMLCTAGSFLDADPAGKSLIESCFGRLQELLATGVCSKRTTCLIQDLIDARRTKWFRKTHKDKAKGLSDLKEEVENADLVGGSVIIAQFGNVVQLGQRSNLENESYAKYLKLQEDRYKKIKQ